MSRRLLIAISSLLLLAASAPEIARADSQGVWVQAGTLTGYRQAPFAARLPDGSVLLGGGSGVTTERYVPATNTWAPAAPTSHEREAAAAVTLTDGRVLVAGGRSSGGVDTNTAEIFDPATGAWTATGSMHTPRGFFSGVLLADGRVLVVGGGWVREEAEGAEIWDPVTGLWTVTGPMVNAGHGGIARLADGRVLAVGGWDDVNLASAELYDPSTNTWTATGSMAEARTTSNLALLPDGRVLVAGGGATVDGIPTASRTTEIFAPATGTWSAGAPLNAPRGGGSRMGLLPDGRPFVSGGFLAVLTRGADGQLSWVEDRVEDTIEIFDTTTGTWWQSLKSGTGRSNHASVALTDGTILLAGGFNGVRPQATYADRLYPPGTTPPVVPAPPLPPAQPPVTPKPATLSKLPSKLTVDRKGRIAFSLRCAGPATCTDTLTVKTRKGKRLARTKLTVMGGRRATVRIKLSKTALRSVKRGSTKVTLELATRKLTVKATLKRR